MSDDTVTYDDDWHTDEVIRWFDNDQVLYDMAMYFARSAHSKHELARRLSQTWGAHEPDHSGQVNEALVDWMEVAESVTVTYEEALN